MYNVAVVVGSLRKESINKKLAHALDKLNHPTIKFTMINIDDIPLYNQDLESNFPEAPSRLKEEIAAADAVLFVTPEYNRAIPGVLKNVIDWGSRPYGKNSWTGKLTAIAGTSTSGIGTAVAQSNLRSILSGFGTVFLGQPEVYLVFKDGLINDAYEITNEGTKTFLQGFMDVFCKEIEKFKK